MATHRLESLLAVAERVTVDLIAQELVTLTPMHDTPGYAMHVADRENFDVIPLKEPDGRVTRYVRRAALTDTSEWDGIQTVAIGVDEVIAASSPILDLLERFDPDRPHLFVLDRRSIHRIATVYDLNQPAAHQFAFGLALVVEAELTRAIEASFPRSEDELDRDFDERIANAATGVLGKNGRIKSWRERLDEGDQIRLLNNLVLYDKIELIKGLGLARELAKRVGVPYGPDPDQFVSCLHDQVRGLRNAVAHDGDALADEWTVWEWMRTTLRIARRLADV